MPPPAKGCFCRLHVAQPDFRLSTTDDVGQRRTGTVGHGPAECSVPGVEVQIGSRRTSDKGGARWCCWAQAAPEFGLSCRMQFGKQLLRALHQCLAAHSVEIGVIPIEFDRSGDTQALPKA